MGKSKGRHVYSYAGMKAKKQTDPKQQGNKDKMREFVAGKRK